MKLKEEDSILINIQPLLLIGINLICYQEIILY
nr:MAG TPA: hypothetical protein [Bacteriophage sp.]